MVFGFVAFGQRILGCCRDGVDLTRDFCHIGITLSGWFLVIGLFGQRILGCCRDGVDLTRGFFPIGITKLAS